MKLQLTLILVLVFLQVRSQSPNSDFDLIYWSEGKLLTFSDFKGRPYEGDTTSHEAGNNIQKHKLGAIVKSIDVHLLTEKSKSTFTIRAGMNRAMSWIQNFNDTAILKHEQAHFDICEIYARILRREITKASNLSNAKEIYDKISSQEEAEQDNFDQANAYEGGGITIDWTEKIKKQLKELEGFKDAIVILPFDK
jgi:hypothetical protein